MRITDDTIASPQVQLVYYIFYIKRYSLVVALLKDDNNEFI